MSDYSIRKKSKEEGTVLRTIGDGEDLYFNPHGSFLLEIEGGDLMDHFFEHFYGEKYLIPTDDIEYVVLVVDNHSIVLEWYEEGREVPIGEEVDLDDILSTGLPHDFQRDFVKAVLNVGHV